MNHITVDKLREVLVSGHFVLSSGLHTNMYVEKFRLLEDPKVLSEMVSKIVEYYDKVPFDYVVGPATGGMIVAYEVARQLGIEAVYVDSVDGQKILKRGKTLPPNQMYLVVDDIFTTGNSLRDTIEVLKPFDPFLVKTAVLFRRGNVLNYTPGKMSKFSLEKFDYELYSCEEISLMVWEEDKIPEELSKIPISEVH